MHKLLRFFLIVFFGLLVFPATSKADKMRAVAADQFDEAFTKAIFVGKVEVIKIDKHPTLMPSEKEQYEKLGAVPLFQLVTLRPVQSYKTPFNEDISVFDFYGRIPNRGFPSVGTTYEEMIWPDALIGDYRVSALLPEEAWVQYRKTTLPSPALNEKEKRCAEDHGKWVTESWGYLNINKCAVQNYNK